MLLLAKGHGRIQAARAADLAGLMEVAPAGPMVVLLVSMVLAVRACRRV
jgi:hypothetical protein